MLGLAREIAAVPSDGWLGGVVFGVFAHDPRRTGYGRTAEAPVREEGRIILVFRSRDGETERFEIDEITGDLLETSRRAPDGSLRYVTRFSGWRNAGGLRIAAATEGHDPGSRTVTRITAEVEERPASEVAAEIRRRAAGDWLLLRGDLPEPAAARAATGGDRAGPADWLTLALFEAERGQPDRALEAFHRLRETSPAVPGLDLMEAERLGRAGRRDEAAALLARVAGVLATEREPGMRFEHFLSVAMPALTPEAELGLLEDLRERLPPDFWKDARRRLDLETARLLATVRPDDRIAFLRALVAERSEDPHFLRDAAYTLFNYGDPEEAAAVARAAIRAADRSAPQFATQMRSLLLDCLYRAGNWPEILAETGRWLDLDGQSGAAFSWRLRALDALDRPEEAASLVLRELAEGTPTGLWSSPLDMAVGFALGDQTATVRPSAIPDAYRVPLARAAIRLAKGEEPRGAVLARTILDHPRFRDSPEAASARADLIAALLRPGAALEEPLGRLANLVTIFAPWSGTEAILVARSLESALRARRETADDAGREAIDDLLLTLSEAGGHTSATAALLRERLRAACSGAVNPVLVGRLLLLPFDEENEEAVLCALPLLIGGPTAEQQAMNAAGAARQVVDELLSARLAAGGGAAESRRALAARLGDAASRAGEPLRSWLTLEALRLSVAAGEEPAESERRFVELIQNPPATGDPRLDARFLDQAWTGLSALALGSGGGSEITERVLARSREALSGPDAARAGYRLGRLLAALDRRADLLALLSARPSPVPRFETAEVLLLAAEGRIEEAAAVLEAALEDRLPSAEEYGTLAGLLGLLGRKEKRREALDRRYAALEFHRLAEELRGRLPPATAAAPPSTPDPELYRMFEALLARGSAEEIARSLWLATRDARALTPLIAGVPRGSTEANCAELAGIRRVLLAVEDPAALEVLAAAAREKARVGEDAGRRALRFVEALCALRTAEITGDDGPAEHIAAPALRDAVPVAAPPAERRAWARLLAQLARSSRPPDPGRLAGEVRPFPAPFARELLRLLGALTEGLDPGTAEGAPLAQALAAALWAEGRGEEAIALLARTLEARRPASDTSLPADLLPAADLLAGWCEKAGKYRLAEDLLAGEARRQTTPPQKTRYILKLLALRPRALAAGAALAAGEGASLWHSALREAVDALAELPAESLSEAVRAICDLALAAHGRDIPGVAPALASFYGERITGTLDRAGPGAPDLRVALARTIARTGDPAAAFRMLLEGLEAEVVAGLPPGGDRWSVVARGMGDLGRKELPRELLDRFHAVLLARLKSELAGRAPDLLSGGHEWYWSERKDEVAAEVAAFAARHPDDPAVVLRAAGFLRRALGRPKDGVALLLAGVAVDEPSFGVHETLAKWLVEDRTHAEAVPHLVKCVEMKPDDPSLRLLLLNALAAAGRPEDAARCAGEAEARLRRGAGPPPRSLADLAAACLAAGIPDSAARLFEEAICAASTDSAPAAGWRMGLAKALSTLGRPAEAVRALIGTDGGQHAVREVIAAGKDPARFAAEWARIVTESGRDDGVVRAAVGSLLLDRGDGPAAVRELRIAVSLRPDDPAVFSALLNALDGTDDVEGAIELLSEALRRGATGPDRAVELGRRLGRLRRGTEAARAIASALELAPRDVRARKEYAEALASAWRPEDALAQRAIIVRLTPDDPRAWYELVLANIAKGHIEEARRLLGEMADRPWPRSADDAKRLIQSAESRLPPR
ncbi:MAG: hypothetical protein MUE73_09300 [Planctomycetes bacterium]|nr:hypothetical protein [Planctomycetota bacterium]